MADPLYAEASLELNRYIVNLLDSLSALHELTEISLRNADESQLLKDALGALMSNQDMERCSIFLLNDDATLTNAAGMDWDDMLKDISNPDAAPAQHPPGGTPCRLGEGIMGRAAASGKVEHCRSCADDPQFKKFGVADQPVQGALICVPITCERQVLGVLNVFYPLPGFFNMWHERLLLLFCKMLGRLLLNHRFTHHLSELVDQRTRELVSQRQFLQSVIDGIPEPVMVIGTDYRVILSNHPDGKSGQPQQPRFCHQISHHRETPCDSKEHPCPLELALKEQKQTTVIHEHFNAQGELRQVELLASPLRDKNGAIFAIIESAHDITERLHTENALRELNETLESRVREQVAKNLESERLLMQQARLATMGEMIGNIAHQWRQPINALALILANIRDAYEYDELDKPYLDEAVDKGKRLIHNMSETIDDFRNFFKPNKQKQNFSLRRAITDTLNLVDHSFRNNAISIHVDDAGGSSDFEVSGFPNEFSQALLNILTNAKDIILERKIPDGRVEIRLGRDGDKVFVALRDNAGGIAADILPKIFDPYFSTKETGTGIGLYMSRMVMENMNGSIMAKNIGEGAEFTLMLPEALAQADTPPDCQTG